MPSSRTDDAPPVRLPLSPIYRGCVLAVAALGGITAVLAAAELVGLAARGSVFGRASDAERVIAIVVGLGMQPFLWSVLHHGAIGIDGESLSFLRLGIWCRTERIPLARIRRFGHGALQRQGRPELHLVIELDDRTRHDVKLSIYRDHANLPVALAERLHRHASATRVTLFGVKFAEDE